MKTREEINTYHREWCRKNKDRCREYNRSWRLKIRVMGRTVPSRVGDGHVLPGALRLQALRWKKKLRVVELLGGKCAKCGIVDPRLLQINHINGGGTAEYKRLGHYKLTATILNGARSIEDLNLLCANCNLLYEFERGARYCEIETLTGSRDTEKGT